MGLKRIAFDTAMSSTLNSLGFIAATFEKGWPVSAERVTQRTLEYQAFTATTSPEASESSDHPKWVCVFQKVVDADVCFWKASEPLLCSCFEYQSNNPHYSSWKCCSFLFMMENETRGWEVSSLLLHFNMENNILQGLRMNAAVFAMPAVFVAFRDPALSKYVHSGAKYSSWPE